MDDIDRRIIGALSDDAKLTLQQLSERIALSPSAARERVRRLEDAGIITGYHAQLDPQALGYTVLALVEIELPPGQDADRFEAGLRAEPAVVEAVHATGDRDYLVRLLCVDPVELHRVVRGLKQQLGAARTETRVILDQPVAQRPRLPS
jgi:Lrp/AsnC family transcriptional regulator, leucine-responsive regulatory protein